MDAALRYELEYAIPELNGEIYPTNAPKTSQKPYLVYYKFKSEKIKTLDGYVKSQGINYMFSVMAKRYESTVALTHKVEAVLLDIIGRNIGEDKAVLIEDLTINNIEETYEHNLELNRSIVDFTIYFGRR